MTAELGTFFLCLALSTAALQMMLPLAKTRLTLPLARSLSSSGAWLQWLCTTLALLTLILLRLEDDFSVVNVAVHSSTSLPTLYKIVGTWGSHEGSMLLWVWVLAAGAALTGFSRIAADALLHVRALAAQGAISMGSLLFVLLTSNPFARRFPPAPDGNMLNPLLQDIGLALHPPLLYAGYVGFSLTFSLSVAAMLDKGVNREWARLARPWILASWSLLTFGIGLGSWWAYRELGWGGWWFWDPVENASLLPWLAGTALLHSSVSLEKRGVMHHWVLLLSIFTFALSLVGTFLVRSGLLTSVHSFASDPGRGLFILTYASLLIGGALALYAVRAHKLERGEPMLFASREGALAVNNLFTLAACGTLLLGTLYPLLAEFFGNRQVSVGAPYFNKTVLPMLTLMLPLLPLAMLFSWRQARLAQWWPHLLPVLLAATAVFLTMLAFLAPRSVSTALGAALSVWLIGGILTYYRKLWRALPSPRRVNHLPRRAHGMALAHLGVALLVAGVAINSHSRLEDTRIMRPGDQAVLGGYVFLFRGESYARRENHLARIARIEVHNAGGDQLSTLFPEYRIYAGANTATRATNEASIKSGLFTDIYAVLTEADSKEQSTVRLYINPFMQFIWAACLCLGAGGMLAAFPARRSHPTSVRLQETHGTPDL